jgi:hypothetical protein
MRRCRRGQFAERTTSETMKNFPDAAFSPEVIELMTWALDSSVAALPDPVSASHITVIAESILRTAKDGEREVRALQRVALLELALTEHQ